MRISEWSSDVCSSDLLARRDSRIAAAKQRLESEMAAFRQAMGVQSGIVENVRDDAETLKAIVDRSQGAEGGLQAAQATDRKSTRLNSSHYCASRMPSSARTKKKELNAPQHTATISGICNLYSTTDLTRHTHSSNTYASNQRP